MRVNSSRTVLALPVASSPHIALVHLGLPVWEVKSWQSLAWDTLMGAGTGQRWTGLWMSNVVEWTARFSAAHSEGSGHGCAGKGLPLLSAAPGLGAPG